MTLLQGTGSRLTSGRTGERCRVSTLIIPLEDPVENRPRYRVAIVLPGETVQNTDAHVDADHYQRQHRKPILPQAPGGFHPKWLPACPPNRPCKANDDDQ